MGSEKAAVAAQLPPQLPPSALPLEPASAIQAHSACTFVANRSCVTWSNAKLYVSYGMSHTTDAALLQTDCCAPLQNYRLCKGAQQSFASCRRVHRSQYEAHFSTNLVCTRTPCISNQPNRNQKSSRGKQHMPPSDHFR